MNTINFNFNNAINYLDEKIQRDLSCLYQPYILKFNLNSPLIILKQFSNGHHTNWFLNLRKYF